MNTSFLLSADLFGICTNGAIGVIVHQNFICGAASCRHGICADLAHADTVSAAHHLKLELSATVGYGEGGGIQLQT